MLDWLRQPWPWYVAGPAIGLLVPLLLWLGNYQFGVSGNLRHLCAAILPGRVEYFRYDWRRAGFWNLVFAAGITVGGFIGGRLLSRGDLALSPGLQRDLAGLGITDLHGLVEGETDVYAAGDATTCPIKQGGVATQQADAAAGAIAAKLGAPVDPKPFRPVLRGLLLTGGAPEFMRAEVSGGADQPAIASTNALWWPPSKIAGRWLAPYLAQRHDELEHEPAGLRVEAEVPFPSVRRALIGRDTDGRPSLRRVDSVAGSKR